MFAFTLRDDVSNYTVFDVSNALRERGWQVPAYTFPNSPDPGTDVDVQGRRRGERADRLEIGLPNPHRTRVSRSRRDRCSWQRRRARPASSPTARPGALVNLEQNLHLNPTLARRITVRPVALARGEGSALLASDLLGNSEASLVRAGNEATRVATVHAEKELRGLGVDAGTLIKIDVEGAEFDVLRTLRPLLREARPTLIVSWHYFHVVAHRRLWVSRIHGLREKRKVAWMLLAHPYWYWGPRRPDTR